MEAQQKLNPSPLTYIPDLHLQIAIHHEGELSTEWTPSPQKGIEILHKKWQERQTQPWRDPPLHLNDLQWKGILLRDPDTDSLPWGTGEQTMLKVHLDCYENTWFLELKPLLFGGGACGTLSRFRDTGNFAFFPHVDGDTGSRFLVHTPITDLV